MHLVKKVIGHFVLLVPNLRYSTERKKKNKWYKLVNRRLVNKSFLMSKWSRWARWVRTCENRWKIKRRTYKIWLTYEVTPCSPPRSRRRTFSRFAAATSLVVPCSGNCTSSHRGCNVQRREKERIKGTQRWLSFCACWMKGEQEVSEERVANKNARSTRTFLNCLIICTFQRTLILNLVNSWLCVLLCQVKLFLFSETRSCLNDHSRLTN